jgi:hypothetical protein
LVAAVTVPVLHSELSAEEKVHFAEGSFLKVPNVWVRITAAVKQAAAAAAHSVD